MSHSTVHSYDDIQYTCKVHKQHFINKTECFVRRIIRAGTPYTIQSLYTVCYTGQEYIKIVHYIYKYILCIKSSA
jgi:hypothetical protein